MNADNFADLIENPSLLYQVSYQDLKELTVQYPYSANLRLLLTKKCKMEGRKDFEKQLHLTATYSLDRNHLFEQFNAGEEKAANGNYHIAEDYLQLSGLDTPSESAPPATDANILQQGDLEFVEPEVEEIPLVVDLTTSTEEPEATSEAVTDTQIPLKDLAKMDDHKKDASKDGENLPKKSIIFIEDLIPSKKKEQPAPPATESSEEPASPSNESPDKSGLTLSESSKEPDAPVSQEIPLEITEASRPIEQVAEAEPAAPPPAPMPKRSFASWAKEAGPQRISIKYVPKKPRKKAKGNESSSSKTKSKKEAPKAFASKSFKLHDDLASETLAKLHVKQGNFEEAIQIYERLCLIFPKKRTFFAEQIEKLKKL